MRKAVTSALAAAVIALTAITAPAAPLQAQPAQRSAAANAVLAYLTDLPNRAENRVIAGQFGFYGDGEDLGYANGYLQAVKTATGKEIGLTGFDLNSDFIREGNWNEARDWAIQMWRQGRIVVVSWHSPNPFTGAAGASQESGWKNVNQLVTPGNAAYDAWRVLLRDTADKLAELRNAGVVIIWRPFHEMNGAWFWWHRQTQADFTALWKDMYAYFMVERGLNNLLWGYSPNFAWDKWATQVDYFYPGADVVDIVGLDFYGPRNMDVMQLDAFESYRDMVALNKPIGLFEFGPSPASGAGWQDPPYDYSRLPRDIQAMYPKIVFFQAWEYVWAMQRHKGLPEMMAHPWVIDLAEMPRFDTGVVLPTTIPGTPVTLTPVAPTATPMPSATPTASKTKAPTKTATPSPTVTPSSVPPTPTVTPAAPKGWKIVIEIRFEYQ